LNKRISAAVPSARSWCLWQFGEGIVIRREDGQKAFALQHRAESRCLDAGKKCFELARRLSRVSQSRSQMRPFLAAKVHGSGQLLLPIAA
jgi:hypothetical protein